MKRRLIRTYSNDEMLISRRRMEIMQAASLLFNKRGYNNTSLFEIAKALKMSKGALYHYIGAKEDILHLILDYNFNKSNEFVQELTNLTNSLKPTEALIQSIESSLKNTAKHEEILMFVNHVMVNLDREDKEKMFASWRVQTKYFEKLLTQGIESGEFEIDDVYLSASDIVTFCYRWVIYRWELRKNYTLEKYIDLITRRILKMVLSPNLKLIEV